MGNATSNSESGRYSAESGTAMGIVLNAITQMEPGRDDDPGAFPEHLAPLWDRLRPERHANIQGPWTNTDTLPARTQFDREVRMLRALGGTRAEILDLALRYPEGLGCLRSETGRVLDECWAEADAAAEALSTAEAKATTAEAKPGVAFGRFQLLSVDDLMNLSERGYLLKGIMSPGEMSVWWGPPKCGKSFLLLHIAYALAQGRQVFGRRVRKCKVLYLACEGRSGLRARVEALVSRYGRAADLTAIAQPIDLCSPEGDTETIKKLIAAHGPDLVVVDTVNRVMGGGDENASADMGALISNLDALREAAEGSESGPHIAVIHHGTKTGSNGPRGHGSLLGAVDAGIEISADEDGNRTAKLDAMKDDAGGALAFRLDVQDLGADADGDPRTTCLIAEGGNGEAKKRKGKPLTETQAGWLRDLCDLFAEPEKAVLKVPIEGMKEQVTLTRDDIRQAGAVRVRLGAEPGNATLTNAQRQALHKALIALKDKGKIGMAAELVWLL